jgi:hypothetical protein
MGAANQFGGVMALIEIRSGLLKLEFAGQGSDNDHQNDSQRALVEFVRPAPIGSGEIVRVPLGRRGGYLRELSGQPELLQTKRSKQGGEEYHYRLRGTVATSQLRS